MHMHVHVHVCTSVRVCVCLCVCLHVCFYKQVPSSVYPEEFYQCRFTLGARAQGGKSVIRCDHQGIGGLTGRR